MNQSENPFHRLLLNSSPELGLMLRILFELDLSASHYDKLDFALFLALATEHRVEAVLCEKTLNLVAFPEKLRLELKNLAEGKSQQALRLTGELFRLNALFSKKGIPLLSLKGPLLSFHLSGSFTKRSCRDLDVLIHPEDLEKAKELLMAEGYRISGAGYHSPKQKNALIRTFHHLNFVSPDESVLLELHWKLFASNFVSEKFQRSVWEKVRKDVIGEQEITTLNPVDEFIFLCIHGLRHLWFRLFWLYDLALVLERAESGFLDEVFIRAEKFGLKKDVLQSLDLLNRIKSSEFSAEIQTQLEQDRSIGKLTELSLKAISKRNRVNSPLRDFVAHYRLIRLLDGWKGVRKEIRLRRVKPLNWSFFSFPDRLFYLNVVFSRPIWILRKIIQKN